MRRFPFDRLHHSARRQSRRHIQQQMHMIGSHMPLHDLDIQRSANLSRQIPHLFPDLSSQSRLAVLGDEHKVISQPIHCMRTFPILRHLRSVPPSLLKASPKGEGVHPSQSGTLRSSISKVNSGISLSRSLAASLSFCSLAVAGIAELLRRSIVFTRLLIALSCSSTGAFGRRPRIGSKIVFRPWPTPGTPRDRNPRAVGSVSFAFFCAATATSTFFA